METSVPEASIPEPEVPTTTSSSPPTSGPPPNTRRCFVCLADEPETTLPVDWSTPCECSLEGHQECLLAWVTDLEAQGKEVKCPVCKSPIVVTERYDLAIQLSNALQSKFSRWSPRILLGFIASGTLFSSSLYGINAISWFAGPEAASDFLLQTKDTTFLRLIRRIPQEQPINLVHFSILPLIAPALILNRMNIADVVTLPTSLIYASLFDHPSKVLSWPPSPDRVMALYPVLKSAYFHMHHAISTRLEKSWATKARIINSEQGSHHHTMHDVAPQPEPAVAAMNILDLEIDIQIGEPDDDDDNNGDGLVDNGGLPRYRTADPINFIAGALLWPGVCYGAGELLRRLLPTRFISKPSSSAPPTGLLQERWGRSLIGGCLFVVLKDAFFLYIKYKKMMNRPYRKIKNSDKRNIRN
ncbi:hypothetical protein GGS20DRAFT_423060 [Poronia punctata]|nr:hypothetical protein GGS20DRAFT_423060 [Poronia punctata]